MSLKLYNTLSRQLEEFKPINPPHVKIYACGPTVYNYFHIGNGRTFLVCDLLRRYLEYKGYLVNFIQNLTDIEDKIINRAKEMGVSPEYVSKKYSRAFFEDCNGLGILPADIHPRATDHIPEMLDIIQKLIANNKAYAVDGDVYYAVRNFPEYGKLSRRNIDDLKSGARVGVDDRKHDPLDFALWKSSKPGEPFWESPWGPGRPGWHIECSAMSKRYLGNTFDIHCGAEDLIFPHHENEIAQSEGATGEHFVNYWFHVAFLNMGGEKMSKSLGNFITVREILKQYSAEALRYFILSSHYRSPLEFNETILLESTAGLQRAHNCLENIKLKLNQEITADTDTPMIEKVKVAFEEAMDDDLNSSKAMAVIFDLVTELNQCMTKKKMDDADLVFLKSGAKTLKVLGGVFGLFGGQTNKTDEKTMDGVLQLLITLRQEARVKKDYATGDAIRNQLTELGISLEDSPTGTNWKKIIK